MNSKARAAAQHKDPFPVPKIKEQTRKEKCELSQKKKNKRKSLLHASSCQHLLPEVVLVLANGAVPLVNRPVLAHEDVLGNLV